ncbi:MAG: ubiquitin-like domain-containing protein [Eubacteriales bacterium]|nr:ubiquitin-like domain-containing protein [Eubacteriales bacterium]
MRLNSVDYTIRYIYTVLITLLLALSAVLTFSSGSAVSVTLLDGNEMTVVSLGYGSRVGDALSAAGIMLNSTDTVSAPLTEYVRDGEMIEIQRGSLSAENIARSVTGISGEMERSALEAFADARRQANIKLLAREKASGYTFRGQSSHFSVPSGGLIETPAGIYEVIREMDVNASGYCPCEICCGEFASGITANGSKATAGYTLAAAKDIPFGTLVYIPYFDRVFEVQDRGGAINGNRIDIYFNTHGEAIVFGRRTLKIYIVK